MNKKRLLIVTIPIIIISLISYGVYHKFFDLQGVPKGKLIRTVTSPDGKYEISTFFHNGGSLSSDAVRAELVDSTNHSHKNIYWNYPDNDPNITWISNTEIRIGDKVLNIGKEETYDWRSDDKWVHEKPQQFGF